MASMLLSLPRFSLGRVAMLTAFVLSAIGFVVLSMPHPAASQDGNPFPLVAPMGCVAEFRARELVVTVEPGALLDGATTYLVSESRQGGRFLPKGETRDVEFAVGPANGRSVFAVQATRADGLRSSLVECRTTANLSTEIPLVAPGPCEVLVGDPAVEIRVPDTRVPGEWIQVIYADDRLVAVRSDGDLGLRVKTLGSPDPTTYTVVNRNWHGEESAATECSQIDALNPVKCIALVYADEVRVQAMYQSVAPVMRVLRSVGGSEVELRGQDDSGAGFYRDLVAEQADDIQYFVQSVSQNDRKGELLPCVTRTVPEAEDDDFGVGRCWAEFNQLGLQFSASTVSGADHFIIYGASKAGPDSPVAAVETLSPFGLVMEADLGDWDFYSAAAVFEDGSESAHTPCLFL